MKNKLPAFLVLLAITLIAGVVLGVTYTITEDPIEAETVKKVEQARIMALPQAVTFRRVRETNAEGIVSSATAQGKIGPVYVDVQMDADGTITALQIGDENYQETPSYAAPVLEDAFKGQFIGKKAPFAIQTGADVQTSDSYTASVQGFAGPVAVTVSLNENNQITALSIGDDKFNESEGYGKKALEPAFAQQFLGKQMPIALSDIDAISGATITSKAVVDATNKAYNIANATPIDAVSGATVTSEAVVEAVNSAAVDTGIDWCYEGIGEDGQVVGYVAQTTVKGFGGKVEIITGVDRDLKISGVSVGGSSFSETAGLGAKAKDAAFTLQFLGKSATDTINAKKAGSEKGPNDVDAITAATITSSAVAGGINNIASQASALINALPKPPVVMIKPEVTYTSSSKGYGGPVDAEVGFDDDGTILYLVVGQSNRFAETNDLGGKARSTDFTDQFIGLTGDVTIDEIDAISGATLTSEAVVSAINKSYQKFLNAGAPIAETPAPNATTQDAAPAATDEFTASSKGYGGPVQVNISFDADGKITSLSVGNEKFAETDGLGTQVREAFFVDQFIGKQAPVDIADVDIITGATRSSTAVVNAINKAYEKFLAATPAAEEAAAPAPEAVPVTGAIFGASSKGYGGPVWVDVSFDANGKITSLSVGNEKFAETDGLGTQVKEAFFIDQFIGMQAPVNAADVDIITGATRSSNAVVNAINKAYDKSQAQK